MQKWYVYLVQCHDGTLYCGKTTHMERRLRQHNGHIAGGAKYTRGRRPVVLYALVACDSNAHASGLEAQIKKLPRQEKIALMYALNNTIPEKTPEYP